jgi:dihydropteroate synthase
VPSSPSAAATLVAGILNVTPDSFSDGGRFSAVDAAVARLHAMVAEGADWIDLGGESTRPGHAPVDLAEELRRVEPVLAALGSPPVPISIDTTKAAVARRALALGASIVNDQWGLQGDAAMAEEVAAAGAQVIVMHNRREPCAGDVVDDVLAFLQRSLAIADRAGIARSQVIVDPGFGFGKTMEQNLELLRRLGELRQLGQRILIGTSRKRMIGHVLTGTTPEDRLEGTAATVALGIAFGADIVRVHDVRAMVRVARMTDAVLRAGQA